MTFKVGSRMSQDNQRRAEDAKRRVAGFEPDVTFAPITDAPHQILHWYCPRCNTTWDNFEDFAFDGCSPVFGVKTQ